MYLKFYEKRYIKKSYEGHIINKMCKVICQKEKPEKENKEK